MEKGSEEYRLERAKLADAYISRIRGFQTQLLIWGVSLNYLALTYCYKINFLGESREGAKALTVIIAILSIVITGFIAKMYSHEHDVKKDLIDNCEVGEWLSFSNVVKEKGSTWFSLNCLFVVALYVWTFVLFKVGLPSR